MLTTLGVIIGVLSVILLSSSLRGRSPQLSQRHLRWARFPTALNPTWSTKPRDLAALPLGTVYRSPARRTDLIVRPAPSMASASVVTGGGTVSLRQSSPRYAHPLGVSSPLLKSASQVERVAFVRRDVMPTSFVVLRRTVLWSYLAAKSAFGKVIKVADGSSRHRADGTGQTFRLRSPASSRSPLRGLIRRRRTYVLTSRPRVSVEPCIEEVTGLLRRRHNGDRS